MQQKHVFSPFQDVSDGCSKYWQVYFNYKSRIVYWPKVQYSLHC